MSRKKQIPLIESAGSQFPYLSKKELISLICCREIDVAGQRPADPRFLVDPGTRLRIARKEFVSRGGVKLAHALDQWHIDVTGMTFIDAGSSSGGFTDCLLQRGACGVHAVDVGYNQLDWKLRSDPRVTVWERRNIMDMTSRDAAADAAVMDLSFRSIRKAAAHVLSLTKCGWLIALIKPQFEFPEGEHFDGVVRQETRRKEILARLIEDLADEGVMLKRCIPSPIQGRKGNREYLGYLVPQHMSETAGEPAEME